MSKFTELMKVADHFETVNNGSRIRFLTEASINSPLFYISGNSETEDVNAFIDLSTIRNISRYEWFGARILYGRKNRFELAYMHLLVGFLDEITKPTQDFEYNFIRHVESLYGLIKPSDFVTEQRYQSMMSEIRDATSKILFGLAQKNQRPYIVPFSNFDIFDDTYTYAASALIEYIMDMIKNRRFRIYKSEPMILDDQNNSEEIEGSHYNI